jgi:hypothetical protein
MNLFPALVAVVLAAATGSAINSFSTPEEKAMALIHYCAVADPMPPVCIELLKQIERGAR